MIDKSTSVKVAVPTVTWVDNSKVELLIPTEMIVPPETLWREELLKEVVDE